MDLRYAPGNDDIASVLERVADLLEAQDAESFRLRAYRAAADTVRHEARSVAEIAEKDGLKGLEELPGIGPWSAGLVLLRGLGRLDVFPSGDVGVTRGLGTLMRLPPGASLSRVVERFGDRRGYLYFCSLGAVLLARGLVHAAPPPAPKRKRIAVR